MDQLLVKKLGLTVLTVITVAILARLINPPNLKQGVSMLAACYTVAGFGLIVRLFFTRLHQRRLSAWFDSIILSQMAITGMLLAIFVDSHNATIDKILQGSHSFVSALLVLLSFGAIITWLSAMLVVMFAMMSSLLASIVASDDDVRTFFP